MIGTINFSNILPTTFQTLPKLSKVRVNRSPYEKVSFLYILIKLKTNPISNGTVIIRHKIPKNGTKLDKLLIPMFIAV